MIVSRGFFVIALPPPLLRYKPVGIGDLDCDAFAVSDAAATCWCMTSVCSDNRLRFFCTRLSSCDESASTLRPRLQGKLPMTGRAFLCFFFFFFFLLVFFVFFIFVCFSVCLDDMLSSTVSTNIMES